MFHHLSIALLISLTTGFDPAMAQAPATVPAPLPVQAPAAAGGGRASRPPAPTRDPHTAGYVSGNRVSRRRQRFAQRGRKLHTRSHPPARAGDDGTGERAPRNSL